MSAQTPTVLERILESTRAELQRRKRELPLQELEYQAFAIGSGGEASERRFEAALAESGIGVNGVSTDDPEGEMSTRRAVAGDLDG
jgi:hypothetical protein